MRMLAFAAAAALAIVLLPNSSKAAGRCTELRLACEHKSALGEQGEGNCRRYRETCLRRQSYVGMCGELRRACLHKNELGEQGEGNCRRYRETCRGYRY
jgi:hypothetical protein